MSSSISFRRVTQRFAATTVFQDDSFELRSGLTFLVGRNGAGKSTLLPAGRARSRPLPPSVTRGACHPSTGG
ncbi:AAA family ATPase [Rathayibacter tritici]|uniref:AAA family ATPase n=1 Tax=Rathayibacter tritici TaxID=33888 RepID=UPI0011B00E8F